jgi:hypothetical protein
MSYSNGFHSQKIPETLEEPSIFNGLKSQWEISQIIFNSPPNNIPYSTLLLLIKIKPEMEEELD